MVIKLIRSMVDAIIRPIQNLIISYLRFLSGSLSLTNHHHETQRDHHHITVIIEYLNNSGRNNELYDATHTYLFTKINFDSAKLCVRGCNFTDLYEGVELKWRIFTKKLFAMECFELRFDEKHRDLVFNSYLPFVESKAKEMIKSEKRNLEMHTYFPCSDTWETKSLENHSTFETIVMKKEVKRGLIDDLERFMQRKDFYKKVGRHWMRNYLLHGPPGSGKTSLVAAMANHLNLDVYDLKLSRGVKSDFDPRRIIQRVMDSAILVVEDIDSSLEGSTSTLSQLLSSLAGFWSYGEARIIIFTTNNIERLDPMLLGRMERKIYMGHCCFEGFKTLASNYFGLSHDDDEPHSLYPDIKRLIDGQVVTPAQVAEELMKSEDVNVALEGLVRNLEMKSLISTRRSWSGGKGPTAVGTATRVRRLATAEFTCGLQRPRPPVPGGP